MPIPSLESCSVKVFFVDSAYRAQFRYRSPSTNELYVPLTGIWLGLKRVLRKKN